MKKTLLLILVVACTGCAGINGIHIDRNGRISSSGSHNFPILSGDFGNVNVNCYGRRLDQCLTGRNIGNSRVRGGIGGIGFGF